MADFPDHARFEQDFHNIEPYFDPWIPEQAQIIKTSASQTLAPDSIDGRSRPRPFLRGAGFNLHEHEAVSVSHDQINLAAVSPKICSQKFQPVPHKVFSSGFLAQLARLEMRWQWLGQNPAGQAF